MNISFIFFPNMCLLSLEERVPSQLQSIMTEVTVAMACFFRRIDGVSRN